MLPFPDGVNWLGLFGGKINVPISCINEGSINELESDTSVLRNDVTISGFFSSIPAVNASNALGCINSKSTCVYCVASLFPKSYLEKNLVSSGTSFSIMLDICDKVLSKFQLKVLEILPLLLFLFHEQD